MKLQDLPIGVQEIAAQTLWGKMQANDEKTTKEPVKLLAHEVRDAFIALYSSAESESSPSGSDQASR